ncbi:aKG-HExxH-type peptide beta-hydroxylase [Streptomyces sp. NPDC053541]|uniref:aKG-HExxH-type peptide beta-hydroxylase n=1 Tax=Streptomyces sp. NPDC053541 TaxID=3365709 RepID=UPI0037D592F8
MNLRPPASAPASPSGLPDARQGPWGPLAAGTPGPALLDALRTARRNRNLLLLRVAHRHHRADPDWAAAVALLAEVRRARPAVHAELWGGPEAGAWLARLAAAGPPAGGDTTGHLPADLARFAAAAALRAGLPFRIRVPVAHGTALVLPGTGAAVFAAPGPRTAIVHRDASGAFVVRDGAPPLPLRAAGASGVAGVAGVAGGAGDGGAGRWWPVPRLRLGPHAAVRLDTLDPLRLGGPDPLPPRPIAPDEETAWRRRLHAAWRILTERHPERARTIAQTLRVVVPLAGADANGWRSASFADATGLAALSPVDDPVELAADLVHETQHSLLYAAMDLAALLHAPHGARAEAPWSPRPRPPAALLHGASAFLVTAAFWRTERRLGNPAAERPYTHWRHTAGSALATLAAHQEWTTEEGRRLLGALRALLASWD